MMEYACVTCGDKLHFILHYDVAPLRHYCGACSGCDKVEPDDRCDKCFDDTDEWKEMPNE